VSLRRRHLPHHALGDRRDRRDRRIADLGFQIVSVLHRLIEDFGNDAGADAQQQANGDGERQRDA